jgi:hypothetical protein
MILVLHLPLRGAFHIYWAARKAPESWIWVAKWVRRADLRLEGFRYFRLRVLPLP